MPSLLDIEADMDALDEYLMSDDAPEGCMMLPDLDGFLTCIAIGPELIMPSEWLPVIWGGEEPVFEDSAQAQSILGTIMQRYNEIIHQIDEGFIEPIFMETPGGEVIAADWAEGFMQGVYLRAEGWDKLFKSEKGMAMMLPIMALCCDEDGNSLVPLPQELEDGFFEAGGELVPQSVFDIANFWRAARTASHRMPQAPKVGRNDPCPCGSGKKFKKCCGAD